jgi:predicted nuclease of predicted toxin-antitoxin system
MRFLVDECAGPSVVRWLRDNNYDATSAYEDCRGWDDESILEKAFSEERIVVTLDKDFGDMVFRMKLSHCGIILLRCGYCSPAKKNLDDEKDPFSPGIGITWQFHRSNRDRDQNIGCCQILDNSIAH